MERSQSIKLWSSEMKNLVTQEQYDAALARGREALRQPHPVQAVFLANSPYLLVLYSNSDLHAVDVSRAPELRNCDLALLQNPQLTAGGKGILFDKVGIALNLPRLLASQVPLDLARIRIAAESGRAKTPEKSAAARKNGALGGRPRKKSEEHAVAHGAPGKRPGAKKLR